MPGLAHLYIGEEAVAVGVCSALRRDDYITSTHRGHGHCLAKGADVGLMFAELLGKEAGYCRGKGGSMHIADHANGNLGANAIVGGSTGIATGAAFSREAARHRPGGRLLLRRRRARPGAALRGDEHGGALDAAGGLRLREQPLQRVHALPRGDRRVDSRPAEGVRHPGRRGRRAGRAGRPRGGEPSSSSARARGDGPGVPALQHLPLPRPPRRRRRPRLLPLEGGGGSMWRSERDPIALLGGWLVDQRHRRRRRARSAIEVEARDEVERGRRSSRSTRRSRTRAR